VSGSDRAAPVTALARSSALGLVAGIRPTAGVVGVGVDAVDLRRFARVLGRRASLADRLFTGAELAYARAAADPVPRLSTRFAAKEAVMKALGVGLGAFPFHDVEVVRVGLDAPGLVLAGAAEALAVRCGVTRWHLSLSHTGEVAVALVLAEGEPGSEVTAEGGPGAGPSAVATGPPAKP
jgi:holo-[acyl-carrier protein] synthase